MFSTNGRYALRVMTDLAEHIGQDYIKLEDIAKRQELSKSYMANIMAKLSKAGLIVGKRGAHGGGVMLTRDPKEYTVAEILTAADEKLAPVACLLPNAEACPRADFCPTRKMWVEYGEISTNYLNGKTLADIVSLDERYSAPALDPVEYNGDGNTPAENGD